MTDKQRHHTPEESKLQQLRSIDPYNVPEGYFDRLQSDILKLMADEGRQQTQKRRKELQRWIYGAISTAAIAVLLFNILPRPNTQPHTSNEITLDQAFERLSDEDREYLIDNYRSEMAMDFAAL